MLGEEEKLTSQNNEDENNNKLIESISNSEHGSEDNKSEYDKKLEESDTKVNFAPTNWRQEQEEEVNINEIQKISADQLRENIRKEVELINSTTVLRQTDGFYYYKCSYIFDGLHLENLLLGHEILTVLSSHILFEPTALNPAHISHDDVFIKAGYLKKLIEHNLHFPVIEKFLQTNTYSKTCKLGVKVKAKSANKRDIYYVKLRESLLHLCSGIYDHPQMFPLSKRARKISTSRPSLFEIIDLDGENSTLNQHAETGIFHPPTFHPPTYSVADSNSYNNQPNKFDLYPNNTNNNNNNSSSVSQFINMKKQLALTSHASSSIAPTLDRLSFSSLFKNQNPYMATSSSSQRLVGVDTIDQSVRSQPRYNSGLISSSHLPPAMTSNRQNNSIASANTSRHNDSIGLDGSSSSSDRLVISNEESRATAPAIEQVPDSDDPIQLFRSEMAALSARLYTVELEVARLKAQRIVQIAQFHQQELMFLRQQQQLASHIHPESFEPTDDIADSTLQPQPWLPRPGHVMAVLPPGVSRLSKENMDKAFYFGLTGQNSSQPDHPFSLNPLETEYLNMDEAGAMQMSEDQLLQYLLVQQVAEHSRLYNQSTAKPSRSSHLLANSYRSNVAQIPSDTHRSYHQSNVDDSHAELDTSFNSEGVASASDALINMRKPATQQSGAQPKDKSNSSHENASSEGVQANPTQVTALNPATQVTSTETTTQQMEVDVKVEAPVDQTVEPIQRLAPPRRMIIELRRRKRDSSDQHKE